jgi:hypothetical protein
MDISQNSTKFLQISPTEKQIRKEEREKQKEKQILKKEKKKRVITTHNAWKFTEQDLTHENQQLLLQQVYEEYIETNRIHKWVISQIKAKIYGYLGQDAEKGENIKDPEIAIKIELSNVLQKLMDSNMKCFYCRESVQILYEFVREPRQWTLERINNKEGHHLDNVEIACLGCNLKRRTMFHERYVFTKQMKIQKMG